MSNQQTEGCLLRVLHFIPSLGENDGGTTTYMQQLAPVLGQLCDLHVCVLESEDEYVQLEGCQTHQLSHGLFHWLRMRRQWRDLLQAVQPDVIHINGCWMPQIALITKWSKAYAQAHPGVRLFLTPHGMLEPWIMRRNFWRRKVPATWLYQRRAVAKCDALVATAESEREHLLHLGWNRHVYVVENGINVSAIEPKTEWRAPRYLLFMSRLHPKKGLELLLRAMVPYPQYHLTIAGMGEENYVEQLRQLTASLQLSGRVTFAGAVFGQKKWQLIRQADAVVLPSYSENYGLIVAESLAAATPVITTTGTPWEAVAQQGAGWWVDPTVEALTEALGQLGKCTDEDMQRRGQCARQLAERECSITLKVNELYKLYLSKTV